MKRPLPGSAHEALDRMFDSIGRSHGDHGAASEGIYVAAAFLDLFHTTLRKQLDPDQPGDLSFGRVAQLTRQFGCAEAAEHLALCAGGVFVPMPDGEGRIAEMTAEAMQEMGEAVARIFAAAAPGSEGGVATTPAEARAALPLMRDVLVAVSRLYAELADKARG